MSRRTEAQTRLFYRMIACAAARSCYNSGASIKDIAAQAKKSPAVIRRWLKVTENTIGARHA